MPVPRKLLIRVVGAPLLLAALGAILYWGWTHEQRGIPNAPLMVLLFVVALVTLHEIRAMGRAKGIEVAHPAPLLVLSCAVGGWVARGGPPGLGLGAAAAAGLILVLLELVCRFGKLTVEGAALSFFGLCYVGLLGFLLIPPVPQEVATLYLLFLLACSKGSDMAAFVVGKAIGKHPMAPVVSPNKTWEGGIAGGVAGTAAGFAVIWGTPLQAAYAAVPVPALLGLALLVTIAAQVGDLVKSAFKRWAGVKDSGRLLPEFGGMLDMVDSFLVAGPVAHFATVLLLRAFE